MVEHDGTGRRASGATGFFCTSFMLHYQLLITSQGTEYAFEDNHAGSCERRGSGCRGRRDTVSSHRTSCTDRYGLQDPYLRLLHSVGGSPTSERIQC